MNDFIELHKEDFENAISHLTDEYRGLRTGVANPAIVENISVESYGVQTPIKQMANITVPDSKTIMISPWDKSLIKEIEKAITNSSIGINPASNSDGVILNMPMMTEENRKDLVKIVLQKAEETRISGRTIRDKVKESIIKSESDKEITEDDRYKFIKELDEYIGKFNDKVKEMAETKEKEIMTL